MIQHKQKVFWSKEHLPNDLLILLENLSSNNQLSVKDLYEDYKERLRPKKVLKETKKQRMINENIKRINQKKILDDRERVENYTKNNTLEFEKWLQYCKTDEGREELKIQAIRQCVDIKNDIKKIELLLQIRPVYIQKSEDKKFYEKQLKKINKLNLKRIQLKCLGNRLPPLDFYNKHSFQLEDWQVDIIDKIKNNESVIVSAPTSSGKTVISTYFAHSDKTILYIVPSKPLAFQVAAIFYKIVKDNINIYVEDFSYKSSQPRIVIGTPYEIESVLPYLDLNFDLAVYDEIHNLNYFNGDCYERIIKLNSCNFLALSATINNLNELTDWWKSVHPHLTISNIVYKKRFINIQRHIWYDEQSKISKIHPLACLEGKSNSDSLKDIVLPFTPWDSYVVWDSFKEVSPKSYEYLDPEQVFSDTTRLTLNDAKSYEEKVKYEYNSLTSSQRDKLLENYKVDDLEVKEVFDIYKLVINLKKKHMTPAIIFNTNHINVMEMFTQLIDKLSFNEELEYPFHYNLLEELYNYYQEYKKRKQQYESNLKLTSQNKEIEKFDKIKKFDNKEQEAYRDKLEELFKKYRAKIEKKDIELDIKSRQLNNLNKTYLNYINKEFIEDVDMFEKHQEYSFTRVAMKANRIRALRKEIESKLDIKIKYENYLIQGLKRGVGIYSKNLPDIYLRIVQELAQNKELGIVISDDSLALGINMPFKSVVIAGWKSQNTFDKLLYHQMIGRAGRRGLDTEGNVVYVNVDWKNLVLSKMDNIIGKSIHYPETYQVGKCIECGLDWSNIYKPSLGKQIIKQDLKTIDLLGDSQMIKIVWKLRQYFRWDMIDFLNYLEMDTKENDVSQGTLDKLFKGMILILFEKQIFDYEHWNSIKIKEDKFNILFTYLSTKQVLRFDEKHEILENLIIIGNVCKIFYNNYMTKTSLNSILYQAFITCRLLRFKYYYHLNN